MNAPETIDFRPRGAVRELFTRHDPEILVEGPAGTGKTRGILELFHLRAMKYPGSRWLFARKTRKSLTQSVLVTFDRQVRPDLDGVKFRVTEQEYRYPNGSRIIVAGLDEPTKVKSTEYDGAFVNEATELDVGDWEEVSGRLRFGPAGFTQLVGDCNPEGPLHWLHRRTIEPDPETGEPRTARLLSRHEDNPAIYDDGGNLTIAGAAYLRRLRAMTGHRRARLLLGQWVSAEGRVYDNFVAGDDTIRTLDPDELAAWRRILAIDIGVRNPTAILAMYVAADFRQFIAEEFYQPGLGATDVIAAAGRMALAHNVEAVLIDPSAAGYKLDLEAELAGTGILVEGADNDRKRGVGLCREAIDAGLIVSPSCPNFLREIEGYHFKPNSATDDPVKIDDHAMDAWRYGTVYVAEPALEVWAA